MKTVDENDGGTEKGKLERMMAHIPWETVTWAVVALVLGVTLYCVLGRKVGAQGVRQSPLQGGRTKGAPQMPVLQPPPLPGSVGASEKATEYTIADSARGVLPQIAAAVRGFAPDDFLRQVETAFREILAAYARGDRAFLEARLTPAVFASFSEALDRFAREGLKPHVTVRRIERVSLENAAVIPDAEDPAAMGCRVTVEITSWQVSDVTDAKGAVVEGTEALTEFHDLWSFIHMPGASGPAMWRLAGTAAV